MNKENSGTNKGFSLVELIIAIAILVVLTGLLAPQLMRYIERSRAAVCRKNRDEMVNIYKVGVIDDDKYSIIRVITEYIDKKACPSKGVLFNGTNFMKGVPWILCSIHDGEIVDNIPDIATPEYVYSEMVQFTGLTRKQIAEIIGRNNVGEVRNDTMREYLWKNKDEEWPRFSDQYIEKHPGLERYYIQPYLNLNEKVTEDTNETDVIIFANSSNLASGNWYTDCIYNPVEQIWYKGGGFSIDNKSWDDVWAMMQDKNWKPLK